MQMSIRELLKSIKVLKKTSQRTDAPSENANGSASKGHRGKSLSTFGKFL